MKYGQVIQVELKKPNITVDATFIYEGQHILYVKDMGTHDRRISKNNIKSIKESV